ncbi:hypothetical protein VPH35_058204 [Triticum aestivum]
MLRLVREWDTWWPSLLLVPMTLSSKRGGRDLKHHRAAGTSLLLQWSIRWATGTLPGRRSITGAVMEHRRDVGKSVVLQQSIFGHPSIAGAAVEHRRAIGGSSELCWCCDGASPSRQRIIGALPVLRWTIPEPREDCRSIAGAVMEHRRAAGGSSEHHRCCDGASPSRRRIVGASPLLRWSIAEPSEDHRSIAGAAMDHR